MVKLSSWQAHLARTRANSAQYLVRRLVAKHGESKAHILKLFHALKVHPSSYRVGKPSRQVVMTKSIPSRAPAGYTKEASGVFNWFKKQWGKVTGLFHKHKKRILSEAKKHASAVGSRALEAVTKYAVSRGTRVAKRGRAALDYHVDSYVNKAAKAISSATDRADKFIDRHTRFGVPSKKAGSIIRTVKRQNSKKL